MSRLEDLCRQLDVVAKDISGWSNTLHTQARELSPKEQVLMRAVQLSNSHAAMQAIVQLRYAIKKLGSATSLLSAAERKCRAWITASALSGSGNVESYTSSRDISGDQQSLGKMPEEMDYIQCEIDTLRKDLELTAGDASTLQIGGLHKDVTRDADKKAAKYESHHIPSQGALSEKAGELPAIALTQADHKLTDSYAGKQGKQYTSFLPDVPKSASYKEEVMDEIDKGGFMFVVRCEIYNIRDRFGHKYDGAIALYLDALSSYIAQNGVPERNDDCMRGDAICGPYTVIRPDGSQYIEGFGFVNESTHTQDSWNEDAFDIDD